MEQVASKANVLNKFLVNLLSTLRLLPKVTKFNSCANTINVGQRKPIHRLLFMYTCLYWLLRQGIALSCISQISHIACMDSSD